MPKRKRPASQKTSQKKKQSQVHGQPPVHGQLHHPVISQYYRQVVSLRQYLLAQLPGSSKVRRRRLASLGTSGGTLHDDLRGPDRDPGGPTHVPGLVRLLDTTLVGVLHESPVRVSQERQQAQSQSQSQLGTCSQSEIVEHVVGLLLNQNGYQRSQHLLAQGFQRFAGPVNEHKAASNIPGVVVQFENKNVQALQRVPWTDVLDLLGSNGEDIMLRLLLDCAVFPCIDDRKGVYYQLSGLPLSALEPRPTVPGVEAQAKDKIGYPNSIVFLRRRALYARPALNAQGEVRFGLKHDHVLNRLSSAESLRQTVTLLQYMFPRQFGLPNVFTSKTPQGLLHRPFRLEDQETPKIPKRLRGTLVELVQGLQRRNRHCAYTELLRYYCPDTNEPWKLPESDFSPTSQPLTTQPPGPPKSEQKPQDNVQQTSETRVPPPKYSLTDYATPAPRVSAFCRAVLRKLIPPGFFGTGENGEANKRVIFRHVDRFVRMRRFESPNLHEVCQGLKITCIPWLAPGSLSSSAQQAKLSLSDKQKRTELLQEFVYFLFDTIVTPLLRTNFYVTESQTHRNRLFFFRHDVWRRLTEQPLAELKNSVFEELKPDTARRVLGRRSLGYSSLRLLPKITGVRPILNLRRRTWTKSRWPGKHGAAAAAASYLGPSINSAVTPVYHMLSYERARGPDMLGSSLNCVGDIHLRLRGFKERCLRQEGGQLPALYFVKLDIQSCFDTIPQQKLIRLIEELVSEETYRITKHVELRPGDEFAPKAGPVSITNCEQARPQKKFAGRAAPATKAQSLPDAFASGTTSRRRNTVFVDTQHREHNSEDLLDLLDEHVRNNLVRIGKKYFRQRNGIPQGSMLSSLLCNYFYAELEREVLHPILDASASQALLLRLVDDFLLVTSDVDVAVRFLRCMLRGHPAYGITVNASKSLTNFSTAVEGVQIPRLDRADHCFPYCGNLIHTQTLEISRDQQRALEGSESNAAVDAAQTLSNALTVESGRAPGKTLHRKVLAGFKLQMHPMYLDTQHNSRTAVMANLYANMVTSAMKMVRYLKVLGSGAHGRGRGRGRCHDGQSVVIRIIQDITQLAQRLLRSRQGGAGGILPGQVSYLTTSAFRFVLGRKQTRYAAVLRWLDGMGKTTRPKSDLAAVRVGQVVRDGNLAFGGWRF